MNQRQLFLQYLAPTTDDPIALEIDRAQGNYLYSGREAYLDLIGGISVANIGHGHPKVVQAVQDQAAQYMHTMVYGELIQSPQYRYAEMLIELLGAPFESIYFTSSGSEAIEAAMKLAKRYTGRTKIFAFRKSYHGSTQGALSILGDEYWKRRYRPLLPEIYHFQYNEEDILLQIDEDTAAVILEPIQAEAGIVAAKKDWLISLRNRCDETGTLLIFDEIQTGFGRSGSLFAFQSYEVVPDIIALGKALGGGMPLGGISSRREILQSFAEKPILGHITTFGGHPVCCAAGMAAAEVLLEENMLERALETSQEIHKINHPRIHAINQKGLWAAIHLDDLDMAVEVSQELRREGMFTDWFLFAQNALRLSPPLTITTEELRLFSEKLYAVLDRI